jgi:DNA-binding SARP family transcriptional activator
MEQGLRVRVLGATELTMDGRPLVGLASAKATALLVHLALTGTAQSRSALAGLLWSDLPEETARANLRLALTKLRRVLPEQLLVTRQSVALDPARPVWVDAVEVERLVAARAEGEELLAGARLCRGELLAGFEVQGPSCSRSGWSAGGRPPGPTSWPCWSGPSRTPASAATPPPGSRWPAACWSWSRCTRRPTGR